ncbi:MAG: FtsX-like permease family protein, partial [Muribaculaceae bacterium]|nr:FtsX-like permease family protein [Muribaculaceae bacterium]
MLALRIALRYLFAPKSHKAVNVISIISVAGVAVATAAIVVVLSVFNGFTDLAGRQLSRIDPDLRAVAVRGKVFAGADSLAAKLETLPEVASAMPVLKDRALVVAGRQQMPVRFMAVDPGRIHCVMQPDSIVIDGVYSAYNGMPDSLPGMQISVGVALSTGMRPSPYAAGEIYVPRRRGRINPANPAGAYRSMEVAVTGVTQVEQQDFDNDMVILPLEPVRELLEYSGDEASSIDIRLAGGVTEKTGKSAVGAVLGDSFSVLTRRQQSADTYRMIAVEKWVTFLMLVFILLIASFNIISTLSLLVIEKRDNMATLRALGAPAGFVTSVFADQGMLITICGGVTGAVAGIILVLAQQYFSLIKLDGDPSALTIEAYPVRLAWTDVGLVLATVAVLGVAVAQVSRLFTRRMPAFK